MIHIMLAMAMTLDLNGSTFCCVSWVFGLFFSFCGFVRSDFLYNTKKNTAAVDAKNADIRYATYILDFGAGWGTSLVTNVIFLGNEMFAVDFKVELMLDSLPVPLIATVTVS